MAAGRNVTIVDVAALAGVAVGTASKALNGKGSLRPETRARVREAAERLRYLPSAAARSLQTGRTYTVGMITTDTIGRFSIPVMMGAEDALGGGEMSVFLCDGRDDPIREQYYIRTLLSRRVDGIIVTGRRSGTRLPIAADIPVPVVYAFISSSGKNDCSVVADEAGGARRAIEHLISTGRRRIAHVTGPEHHNSAAVRCNAAMLALADAGLTMVGGPLYGAWNESWGRQAAGALLRSGEIDAVFAGNDQIARGLADGFQSLDRRVPEDIALVGFDNWDVIVEGSRTPLTSVDMDLQGIGRTAAELLLKAIDGHPMPGVHARSCQLVVRESTAPRPGSVTTTAAAGTSQPAVNG